MAKRNVTLSLDEDLARWARVRAAECDKSVSQLVAEMIERERNQDKDSRISSPPYQEAMRAFFAIKPRMLTKPGERLPTRDEMHER